MIKRLISLAAFLVLVGAPAAQAAEADFVSEFRAVCVASQQNLTGSQALAAARGYGPEPDQKDILSRVEGGKRFSYTFRTFDSPPDISPSVNLTLCVMGGKDVSEAQVAAIGAWVATPAVRSEDGVDYRFRMDGSRHVGVESTDAALNAALTLGPVYVLNIKKDDEFIAVTLGRVVLR